MMMTKQATKTAQTARLGRVQFEPHVSSPLRPRVLDPEMKTDEDSPDSASHPEGKSRRDKGKNKLIGSASTTDEAEIDVAIRVSGDVDHNKPGNEKLGNKKLDDDDEDWTRAVLGDITHLLTTDPKSKTFSRPQIVRPSSHNFAPKSAHKVAEQGSEPGPSEKTQTATTTPRSTAATTALSLDLEVELPEQDENIPPPFTPARHRSGTAPSRPRVPSSTSSNSSLDHAEMARRVVMKYRKEVEECEKWNAESRKLVSMRGTRRGRRLLKDSDRINKSPLFKTETKKKWGLDLGELPEDEGLGFEIYVDEDYRSTSSTSGKRDAVTSAVSEDSSSISDFELPSPVFEKSSILETSTPEKK
ncbi:hypothetical protein B0T21DRAFT_285610 [Apiosordaria backusii]|uniref:Uncharacterized protein n=1 Tax=Apiosordaria backusii TaxID=314023 RepID=A0AA40BT94_9PEZI|nr:hypothetical protein B0T21DRAFT_285610 [Apiosordaria backusii]